MSRVSRVTSAGYYHLSNRGVGYRDVFLGHRDKIFFIELLCIYAKQYDYDLHGYVLISNSYHIIIETKRNNLPAIMRAINGDYTRYFNKKIGRVGHLWEGRYKSWYTQNTNFVLELIAYIEYLPIFVGETFDKESYFYSSYRQFVGTDERLPCMMESIVFKRFNQIRDIKSFFEKPIDFERISSIQKLLKRQSKAKIARPAKKRKPLTQEYFSDVGSKKERNLKIIQAYEAGYTQAHIGYTLGISQQAIYKIIKKLTRSQTGLDL